MKNLAEQPNKLTHPDFPPEKNSKIDAVAKELNPISRELLEARKEEQTNEAVDKQIFLIQKAREKLKKIQEIKEGKKEASDITVNYIRPDGQKETINFNFENELQDFLFFYQKTNLDLPPDFKDSIRDIWERNQDEMEKAIEEKGFDGILIIPGNIPLPELKDKMSMEAGYYENDDFTAGVSYADVISQNAAKSRIIFYHKKTLPKIQEENGIGVYLGIKTKEALKIFNRKPNEHMNLSDFLIMERKIFEESRIHISNCVQKSGQVLNTKSGGLMVKSYWHPGHFKLYLNAYIENYGTDVGIRPVRCFF